MKKTTTLKAFMLSLMMAAMMLPIASFAQNDNIIQNWDDENGVRDFATTWAITNNSFGAPLGSGLLILTAVGAGYALTRRRHNRKSGMMVLLVMTMVLGMIGCKKKIVEPIVNPSSNGTTYTINLNTGNGSKVNVNGPDVTFTNGDKILVAYNGKYAGTITHNGSGFTGTITTEINGKQPLYFYFLGNKDTGVLTAGTTTSCTVNISDQTGYPALPVISFAASHEDFIGNGDYSAALDNKCSLMKFNVTTSLSQTICITGMNNKVTVDFGKVNESGDGLTGDTDQGFSYSVDESDGGLIKLKGGSGSPAEKWAIVLPQTALSAGADGSVYTNEETQRYKANRPALDAISSNQYLSSGVALTLTADNSTIVDLSKLVYHYIANPFETLTGTLAGNYRISIKPGATITLSNATINGVNNSSYNWAGLNCTGNATINLANGTTNTVKGFYNNYPGIYVPSGSTLTIQGTGTLDARSNGDNAAGIGSGFNGSTSTCGNIVISSGTITATGGKFAAGIGSGFSNSSCGNVTISGGNVNATGGQSAAGIGSGYSNSSCGTITISGGNVNATGGQSAAGIGSGYSSSTCGAISINGGTVTATGGVNGAGIGTGFNSTSGPITISGGTVTATGNGKGAGIGTGFSGTCADGITIANTVTCVTATKGGEATNSIGAGQSGTCGTVTIGGTVYWNGSSYQNNGGTYLPTSPLVYKSGVALANSNRGDKVCSDGKAYPVDVTLPGGVTVIGVVAYKSGSTGIVLYKQDNSDTYTWENRNSGNPSAVNVYVSNLSSTTSKSWTCGERTQYVDCGVTDAGWSALQTRLSNAGCVELSTGVGNMYWTNTCPNDNSGWAIYWDGGTNWNSILKSNTIHVRPLFVF